jgi:ABC-type transport system substrate-binding protein
MPTISQDGKTVTVKLRQGVEFNDGAKFDAAAVVKSIGRHRPERPIRLTGGGRSPTIESWRPPRRRPPALTRDPTRPGSIRHAPRD